MEEGQNDYPLARAVKERLGKTYHVKDWEETRTYGLIGSPLRMQMV